MAAEDSAERMADLRTVVGKATHDLANALGAVLNYTAFLTEDLAGTPAAADLLPHLERAANRAMALVDDLNEKVLGD